MAKGQKRSNREKKKPKKDKAKAPAATSSFANLQASARGAAPGRKANG